MNRHYYISDNLDELESVENELEARGISTEQIHVLSERDAEVQQHHVHDVPSFLKRDVVNSGQLGVAVGVLLAAIVLIGAYLTGLTQTAAGWLPFIFLAVVLVGFATWEGSLVGLQRPHNAFRQFEGSLREGKHVLFVDVKPTQEALLDQVTSLHHLELAGTGSAAPDWAVAIERKWNQFRRMM
ncbi:magnesium transporter [Pseudomonas sp. UL073]|uniref:Magnesium transporter n=1 Tax=Zestomonas insulae TaxID=2809017 RepID=A0ABS2IC03_9GAMM|nr:magnesium transporter [Pseudomonas insulae]MBM7060641.1 magnesium transporter [Pseudomonas insulae]